MFGFALVLVPMGVAFFVIWRRLGLRQALLDLLAFNLLFNFDLSALLPNNTYLLIGDLLLLALVGYELLRLIELQRYRISLRLLSIIEAALLFVGWLTVAAFINKAELWEPFRIVNYIVRGYLLAVLYLFIGVSLTRGEQFKRFITVIALTSVLASTISIVQTASSGVLLTSDHSDRYLGIFQPLGDKALERRAGFEQAIDFVANVRTTWIGNVPIYRGYSTFDGAHVILCMVAIASLYLLTSGRGFGRWLIVPCVLGVLANVVAINRTAILTLALFGALIAALNVRTLFSPRLLLRLAGLGLLATLLAVLLFGSQLQAVVGAQIDGLFGNRAMREVGSLNGRTKIWAFVFDELERSPLIGSGEPITFRKVGWGTNDNPEVALSTHNSFIEYAYRGGILPPLVLMLLFLATMLRAFALANNQRLTPHDRAIFCALLLALGTMFVLIQTADWMIVAQVGAVFWILCGYLAGFPTPVALPRLAGVELTPLQGAARQAAAD